MRICVLFMAGLMAAGSVISCKSDESAIKEAEEKVFAIHDDVMGKMGDIMKLRKQLSQRVAIIDSTSQAGSAARTLQADEERAQAMRLRQNLTDADSVMMAWMSGYNGDTLTKLPTDGAMRYLADQKDQIDDVKTKVNSSIEQARAFLESVSDVRYKKVSFQSVAKLHPFNDVDKVQLDISMNDIGIMRAWRKYEYGWMSSSNYFLFGSESPVNGMQNNLAYYLESQNESYVSSLKLVLNINNTDETKQAIEKYKEIAEKTFKSLDIKTPIGLTRAIIEQKEYQVEESDFSVMNKLEKSRIDTWKLTITTKR